MNNPRGQPLRQPMMGGLDPVDPYLQSQIAQNKIPFMNTLIADRSPLDETIPYTLKLVWCPTFQLLSITTFLLITIWVLYIICCTQGIDTSRGVLSIKVSVLMNFGALSLKSIQEYEVWRLFTAAFLHLDLLHITMNSLSLSFLLTRIENIYHPLLICTLLFLSAIGGTYFTI